MINPITTKSYKKITRCFVNRNLSADYLLTSLHLQNPVGLEDVKIGELSVHAEVENDRLERLVPYVKFVRDAIPAKSDAWRLSYDGYIDIGDRYVSPQSISSPKSDDVGQILRSEVRLAFGFEKTVPYDEGLSIAESQSFIVLNDLNISDESQSLTLKANFRIDNKDGLLTLVYAAESILDPNVFPAKHPGVKN